MEDDALDLDAFAGETIDLEAVPDAAPQRAVPAGEAKANLDLIMDIPVTVQVVLGSTVMPVAQLLKLGRGAVVKLDTNISDPVDLIVNGRVVARGEVVILDNEDSRFGITLTEIVSPGARPSRAPRAA